MPNIQFTIDLSRDLEFVEDDMVLVPVTDNHGNKTHLQLKETDLMAALGSMIIDVTNDCGGKVN